MSLNSQSSSAHVDRLRLLLSARRGQLGITYDELAAKSGVSRRTIVAVETGTSPGSMETWFRLASTLEICFDELFKAPEVLTDQPILDPSPISPVVQIRPRVIFEATFDTTDAIQADGTGL